MENKEFTPAESLALITNVIMEAKTRFRDNGFAFIFMGFCSFLAALGQFVLIKLGYYQINYYPYFIMPLAAAITFFYYKKKRASAKSKNAIGSLLSTLGIILGLNLMISGFLFWNKFGIALIPFMLIIFSLWPLVTGILIKSNYFVYSGLVINILAYFTFFVVREYHPLVLALVSLIGIVLPGIILNYSHNENHV